MGYLAQSLGLSFDSNSLAECLFHQHHPAAPSSIASQVTLSAARMSTNLGPSVVLLDKVTLLAIAQKAEILRCVALTNDDVLPPSMIKHLIATLLASQSIVRVLFARFMAPSCVSSGTLQIAVHFFTSSQNLLSLRILLLSICFTHCDAIIPCGYQ